MIPDKILEALGDFEQDVDGFYYFWPKKDLQGCFSEHLLLSLADKLKRMNADWQHLIDNDPALNDRPS